ncbi:helix-turn-helix domain-containing protein [Gracilibacillus halophilus]|uniref:helix-turn-helix domain-containing protein n=1 Tax=Gracilibacillus halophilus TaxID=470864 RepID=UPI0003AA854F|nr:AraC family transcriptional regulator [Gracilibacillus halophilus]
MHEIKQLKPSIYSLTLNRLEWVKKDQQYRLRFTLSNQYLLVYIAQGKGFIYINKEKLSVHQKEIYLCKPGDTYAFDLTSGIELYAFHFDMAGEPLKQQIMRLQIAEPLMKYCNQLLSLSEAKTELENFRLQITFEEMIYFIVSSDKGVSDNKLLEAKKYMDSHYQHSIQIEHLANIAQVSEHYFVELFTKQYGVSPIKYLQQQRLVEAKRLLIQSDARLREIARNVGISDEYYFSRWFKKKTGLSPSVFRSNHTTHIAVCQRDFIGQLLALGIVPYAAPLHPKWTPFYYKHYRTDIPLHLSAYKVDVHHQSNLERIQECQPDMIISNYRDGSR